jgi:hypothetical protein
VCLRSVYCWSCTSWFGGPEKIFHPPSHFITSIGQDAEHRRERAWAPGLYGRAPSHRTTAPALGASGVCQDQGSGEWVLLPNRQKPFEHGWVGASVRRRSCRPQLPPLPCRRAVAASELCAWHGGLPPLLQPPGFKYDGAMQRWVRDDRFAGRGLEKIQPLRCSPLAPSLCSCAAVLETALTLLWRPPTRLRPSSPPCAPARPSLQRHAVHSVAGNVGLPEQEGAEAD